MTLTTESASQSAPTGAPNPSRGLGRVVAATMLAALALVLAGIGSGWLLWGGTEQEAATTTAVAAPTPMPVTEETVAVVAAELLPAVVQIEGSQGLGSGVIYDADGLILTAAHVVDGDQHVTVRFADGDQIAGTVVGADATSDVAVVSVDRSGLVPAPLALDTSLEVGQTAIALGSPYGLEGSVTAGVVSATDRAVVASDGQARSVIQTDASINPGNSGGPLADAQGRVIGINDSIFSQSGGNEGLGFALPIPYAKHIADLLVAGEPIQVAFLGVSGTEPTQGEAGALVTGVVPGSPAAQAGIAVGDLITSFGGARVESLVDLAAQVRASQPGDQVTVRVVRAGDELDLSATLAANG
jgi:S1-C subfamily serine protease